MPVEGDLGGAIVEVLVVELPLLLVDGGGEGGGELVGGEVEGEGYGQGGGADLYEGSIEPSGGVSGEMGWGDAGGTSSLLGMSCKVVREGLFRGLLGLPWTDCIEDKGHLRVVHCVGVEQAFLEGSIRSEVDTGF